MNSPLAGQLEAEINTALATCDHDTAEELVRRYEQLAGSENRGGAIASSPWFRSRYLAALVAVEAGQLAEGERRLSSLLPHADKLPLPLATRLHLLAAEAHARLRRPEEARRSLARLSAWPAEPLTQLRILRIRLWLGDVAGLERQLRECERGLVQAGDVANLTLLLCEEGRAWDTAGDLDRAEACWQRAEGLSREERGAIRADVLMQLGRLEHLRGRLQAALDRYESALEVGPPRVQALEVRLRRMLVLLDVGQRSAVETEFAELIGGHIERLPEELRALARMIDELLRGTAIPEAAGGEAAPVRQARRALQTGLAALSAKRCDEAAPWLRRAEELSRMEELPEVLWRALQARGRLAAEVGDEAAARALFEEAVTVSERQAAELRSGADAAAYRAGRGDVVRELLRAACLRGDAEAVLRWQEIDRGRLVLDLLASGDEAVRKLAPPLCGTDRLEAYLRNRTRRGTALLPSLPSVGELQTALPPGTMLVSPSLAAGRLWLLLVERAGSRVIGGVEAVGLPEQIMTLRRLVEAQLERYRLGFRMGPVERADLDQALDALGRGPLGELLDKALSSSVTRIIWIPDGDLHGLPLAALRRHGKYLIETHEVITTPSAALFVHQALTPPRQPWLPRPGLAIAEQPGVLPEAEREAEAVGATFLRRRALHGKEANRHAIRRLLPGSAAVHFACHADFDAHRPLAATIHLPSGETWRAAELLAEPFANVRLVTLSACQSAETGTAIGRESFGLVTALLGAGARAVLAGLWPVADRESREFMVRFYRHRMTNDLPTALALAQRESLTRPDGSPLFWAAFALFGDPAALPAPPWWRRWYSVRHQRWHASRFPTE